MGGEWERITLAGVSSDISYGYTESANDAPVGPHFLRITDIQQGVVDWNSVPYCPITKDNFEKYKLEKGDIVVARTGNSTGENYLFKSDKEAVYASYLIRFRIAQEFADPRFIWYSMRSSSWWEFINGAKTGSAQAGANAKVLGRFELQLPPIPEQRAIAHILGSLDDKIELNREMNRTLEQMAQAIFKSWFIDFDPVVYNAVQAGNPVPERFEQTAVRYGDNPQSQTLPREVLELFPHRFEDSELGEIPAGWDVKPIGDVVSCVGGGTPSTKNPAFWEGGTNPFLTPKDMSSLISPVITDTIRHITDAGVEKISSKQIPPGAVMLSSRAPIGYIGINEVPVSINQGIIAMICSDELPNHYVLLWTMANMEIIKGKAGGTTFAEISKKNFRPIQTIIPSPTVLNVFSKHVESLYLKIIENVQSNQSLGETRDLLLPKLISGELRIPDADKFLEKQQ